MKRVNSAAVAWTMTGYDKSAARVVQSGSAVQWLSGLEWGPSGPRATGPIDPTLDSPTASPTGFCLDAVCFISLPLFMIIFNSLGFWQTRARWLIFLVADSRRLLSC